MNTFDLSIQGAMRESMAYPIQGQVQEVPVLVRDGYRLPLIGPYGLMFKALGKHRSIAQITLELQRMIAVGGVGLADSREQLSSALQCLESMVAQGWVKASVTPGEPSLSMSVPEEGLIVYSEDAD